MKKPAQEEPKGRLLVCMERVKAAQAAVDDACEIRNTWQRQIDQLEEETRECYRTLADANDVLTAREQKLHRELDYLRDESYKAGNCNIKKNWMVANCAAAQIDCEAKASRRG